MVMKSKELLINNYGTEQSTPDLQICENPEPNYDEEDDEEYDFQNLSINCAPLSGIIYKTDARKLHQMIHGFVKWETAEIWIKLREKTRDGRVEFKALQAQYEGKDNKAVHIEEAEVLRNTLYHNNESYMPS